MINLELFCCAGGMAAGFRRAGLEFDVARLETDEELCGRIRAKYPHAIRYFEEPADAFAERYRMQRRLVEVYP